MRYLVTLTPLEPFLFGGDNTFGKLMNDEEKKETPDAGTYLVKSRQFPQQSAILGMIKKEIMIQSGVLTRKVRGEWVDKEIKDRAKELVGVQKFDILQNKEQNFGAIKEISPIFLMQKNQSYIKKVAIDKYQDGLLLNYNPKENIYDNFVCIQTDKSKKEDDIFKSIEQTGNKKGGAENSLFKKTSYLLKDDFKFAFYLECDYELQNSIITLGADRSSFKMEVEVDKNTLNYKDKNDYLVLLSDAYITIPLKQNCEFAITSEISYRSLINKKHVSKHNEFKKSEKVFLYEKGSIFIEPKQELLDNLDNKNLKKVGYNITNLDTKDKNENRTLPNQNIK